MDRKPVSSHFHIQWNDFVCLDWQCFTTRELAMTRAKELARPDEEFTIVEVSGTCAPGGPKAASVGA
jgi:hypothetical protein